MQICLNLLLQNRKTLKSRSIIFNHIPSSNSQFPLNPGFQISLTHCTNSSDSRQHRLLMPVESSASVFTKHHSTQSTINAKTTTTTNSQYLGHRTFQGHYQHDRQKQQNHHRFTAAQTMVHLDTTLFITTRNTSFKTTHSLWPRKKQRPTHGSTITIAFIMIIITFTILLLQCQGGKAIGEFQTPETPNDSRLPRM